MTTETNQPEAQESTVYWKPDEQITIKGTELAALLHLVDLQTVAITQVPLTTLMELFSTANAAKNDIMARLSEEGKLSSSPMETVIPQEDLSLTDLEPKIIPMNPSTSEEIL
jgi:hypothetical protein